MKPGNPQRETEKRGKKKEEKRDGFVDNGEVK